MKKFTRCNTIVEKRKMRNEQKKRKRTCITRANIKTCERQLQLETKLRAQAEKKLILCKNMCRSYYDRWHSELAQRKELVWQEKMASYGFNTKSSKVTMVKSRKLIPNT